MPLSPIRLSGEYQSLSVSLLRFPPSDGATPEQQFGMELDEGFGWGDGTDDVDSAGFGDQFSSSQDAAGYDSEAADDREDIGDRSGRSVNPVLIIIYLVLSLLILGLAGYLIFRTMQSTAQPDLMASGLILPVVPRVSVISALHSVL